MPQVKQIISFPCGLLYIVDVSFFSFTGKIQLDLKDAVCPIHDKDCRPFFKEEKKDEGFLIR